MEVELVEATSIGDMPPVKSVNAIDLEYKVMMKCILWLYIYIYISFSIYVYICRDILFLSRSSVYCKGSFVETSFPPPRHHLWSPGHDAELRRPGATSSNSGGSEESSLSFYMYMNMHMNMYIYMCVYVLLLPTILKKVTSNPQIVIKITFLS